MSGMRTTTLVGPAMSKRLRAHHRPNPVVAPLVASDALRCSRRIAFRLSGLPYDIPFTPEEKARFEDGDYVDAIAAETLAIELGARTQVPFTWLPTYPLKGKADAGYRRDGSKVVVETKSANEKAWSRAVGAWANVPPQPKPEWVVQAGLGALSPSIGAEAVHIILVDNERFEVAEWLIGVDEDLDGPDYPVNLDTETGEVTRPTVRSLVTEELERQVAVLAHLGSGDLPDRVVPGYGLVADPPSAQDYQADPWACRFCPWQPTCSSLPAGVVPGWATDREGVLI